MKNLILLFFISLSFNSFAQQSEYDKLVEKGLQFLLQQNIPAAIIKYEQAYKLDSTRVEANYGLGTAHQFYCIKNGAHCLTALTYLNKAIKINDSYRNCYNNRGSIKNIIKNYKGAIEDYNKAILQYPTKSNYYLSRSYSYKGIGDKIKECEDLKKAANLNNTNAKQLLITSNCQ